MHPLRRCAVCAIAIAMSAAIGCSNPTARPASVASSARAGEWWAYGHDPLGGRFSPLTQISRDNVGRLVVAWTYRTGEAAVHTQQPAKLEATPLMVDAMLYLSTPFGRAIALDPTTGRERWSYDAHADRGGDWGDFANRGVSTWLDVAAPVGSLCRRRIYLGTVDARILALDAATGALCRDFGDSGTVHLSARCTTPRITPRSTG